MRTLIFIAASVLFITTACTQETFDREKEKEAIINVIHEETTTYLERDFEAMYATHVQDSLNIRLTAGADNYVYLTGWEDVSKHMSGDETEDDLRPDLHIKVDKTNFRMRIYENSAFVVCDQLWSSTFGEDVVEISSIQVRHLEKVDGEWKITFVGFIGTSGYEYMEETEELAEISE